MSDRIKQLLEIGSWRLVTEMFRHYPKDFIIIETHPGQGQYDCLTIFDKKGKGKPIFINRVGSIDGTGLDIYRGLLEGTIEEVHKKIFTQLRLELKQKLPPSTPQALVYRLIAAILSQASFAKGFWECRNGFDDSSGWGSWADREQYFKRFPGAKKRAAIRMDDDPYNVPEYRFWFILKNKKPICCFEITGLLWTLQGKQYELIKLYEKHRRLWPVICATIGDQLE